MDDGTRYIEVDAYGAFARRVVKALGKRAASGDPTDLRVIKRLKADVDEAEQNAIVGLIDQGFSLAQIGNGLGISKQAVYMKLNKDRRRIVGQELTEPLF